MHLHVALDDSVPLLHDRDLDNYLTPIMTRLRDRQVVSVWGSKSHGAQSSVQIERAVVATGDLQGWSFAQARPVGSANSSHWKESLRDQIAAQVVQAPPGALEMQVGFRVGPGRAWANLWKQTIDAFGPVLGVHDPAKPFHPQDGRIVRLGLHQTLDTAAGHDVGIALWWRPAEGVLDRGPANRSEPRVVSVTRAPALVAHPVVAPPARAPSPAGDDAAVIEFRNDDQGYLAWVAAHQRDGYVVNTTRSHSPSYLKLHRASCRHVRVLQSGYAKWTTGEYVKICSTSREALERWAMDVAGGRLREGCGCRG